MNPLKEITMKKNWRALLIGCVVACSMGFGLAQAVPASGIKPICPACGSCEAGGYRQSAGFCLCCNVP